MTTTKLYIVYDRDDGKTWTIALPDPKPGLDESAVQPVAQLAITNDLVRVGTARVTAIKEAYYREITETAVIE